MANFGKQNLAQTGSYALTGAKIGSVVPGIGTGIGAGIGAGIGFFKGLFGKKPFNPEEAQKAATEGGYFTVPKEGYPGHPEWKPGTRQWIPAGSPVPGAAGQVGAGPMANNAGIDYNAIREHAIAPIRGIYRSSIDQLKRQQALSGGYNPGYGAQLLALTRGMSQGVSDAATTAEAGIADTKLRELGMNRNYDIANKQLALQKQNMPSNFSKGLDTTGKLLGLIGAGSQALGTFGALGGLGKGGGYDSPTFNTGTNGVSL